MYVHRELAIYLCQGSTYIIIIIYNYAGIRNCKFFAATLICTLVSSVMGEVQLEHGEMLIIIYIVIVVTYACTHIHMCVCSICHHQVKARFSINMYNVMLLLSD